VEGEKNERRVGTLAGGGGKLTGGWGKSMVSSSIAFLWVAEGRGGWYREGGGGGKAQRGVSLVHPKWCGGRVEVCRGWCGKGVRGWQRLFFLHFLGRRSLREGRGVVGKYDGMGG